MSKTRISPPQKSRWTADDVATGASPTVAHQEHRHESTVYGTRAAARFLWRADRVVIAILLSLFSAGAIAEPQTWQFDMQTVGEDAVWFAPEAVPAHAAEYDMTYDIAQMDAWVIFGAFEVRVDATEELDEEFLHDAQVLRGPLPAHMVDNDVQYPDPPAQAGFAATVAIGIDPDGYAYVAITDVIVGDMEIDPDDDGPAEPILVTMTRVRMQGSITLDTAGELRLVAEPASLAVPEGATASLNVRLSAEPGRSVRVETERIAGDSGLAVISDPRILGLADWSTGKNLTFSASRDTDAEAGTARFRLTANGLEPIEIVVSEQEPDCDNDGIPDDQRFIDGVADCDGDLVPDECQPDADGDGTIDVCDECPEDPAKVVPGTCGCGEPDIPGCGEDDGEAEDDASEGEPSDDSGDASEDDESSDESGEDGRDGGETGANADSPTVDDSADTSDATDDGTADDDSASLQDDPVDVDIPPADSESESETPSRVPDRNAQRDTPTSTESPTDDADERRISIDLAAVEELIDQLPAFCGPMLCGAGVVAWVPLTGLSLLGIRLSRRR